MQFEEIKSNISEKLPESILGEDLNATPKALKIDSTYIYQVCELLQGSDKTYFDSLSCLTGIDRGKDEGLMEVIYHLYSIPFDIHIALVVEINRENPHVPSVSGIWRGANWHEREAFDLLGIEFDNHPDLRRILLPEDWEGFPLRKDYQEQEKYHDIKVKY